MSKIKRVVPLEEVREHDYYWDLADLAEIFNHEVVETKDGVWRWKENQLTRMMLESVPVYTPPSAEAGYGMHSKEFNASVSLNGLVVALHRGNFSMEEWMKFYMQMGYSLSGYCDVFGQHEASEYDLPGAKEVPEDHDGNSYIETVIDYMRRIHEGKVLKI
jgi:hypothetical protein